MSNMAKRVYKICLTDIHTPLLHISIAALCKSGLNEVDLFQGDVWRQFKSPTLLIG